VSPGVCRNGHSKAAKNRSNADKCIVCARNSRRNHATVIRNAKRLAAGRARTKINVELRADASTAADCAAEKIRASEILTLIDQKDRATTVWARNDIQAEIDKRRRLSPITEPRGPVKEDTNG
jgi:hypothetical protein